MIPAPKGPISIATGRSCGEDATSQTTSTTEAAGAIEGFLPLDPSPLPGERSPLQLLLRRGAIQHDLTIIIVAVLVSGTVGGVASTIVGRVLPGGTRQLSSSDGNRG